MGGITDVYTAYLKTCTHSLDCWGICQPQRAIARARDSLASPTLYLPFLGGRLVGKGKGLVVLVSTSCATQSRISVIISRPAILYVPRNAVNWQASNLIGMPAGTTC
jgi:hypothetical protein